MNSSALGEVLFSAEQIGARVRELGEAISRDYAGRDLVLAGVLRGAAFFLIDLARAISIPIAVDFIAISSYGPSSKASGVVRIVKDLDEEIAGRDLLVVEDIVDTGLTLGYLLRILRERGPASLKVCTLLDRNARRIVEPPVAYRGFVVPDKYVVGYGLDYQQRYRNLSYIAALKSPA
ncbi:MAG: hprT [candidate division NC10 bacterium]|jgi:hypoxanthine phosphoribosyltransferase|nr:hprT [candidate division NC10 bacterium]